MDEEKVADLVVNKIFAKIKNFFKTLGRYLTSTILVIVAVVLAGVIIASNVVLNLYSPIINKFLAGDTSDASGEEAQNALAAADLVVRDAAAESMVLLKNDNYLPLKTLDKVNLFGWGATDNGFLLTGGGSGGTSILDTLEDGSPRIKVDLTDAFKESGIEYNTELTQAYTDLYPGKDADYRSNGSTGANVADSLLNPTESDNFYTENLLNSAKAYSNVAVAVISRWGAENASASELKSVTGYSDGTFLELTAAERLMFQKLEEKEFEVIVLLNLCNNMELGFLNEYSSIKACLFVGIPGQSGASAIPKILTGEINPSGRTSDTLAYDYQTFDPTYVNAVKNGNDLTYQEGIYFGYKWYETADAEYYFDGVVNDYGEEGYDGVVQYPFGYGLSYTEFTWDVQWYSDTALTADGQYTVEVTVTNNGPEEGKDVVQLYGHAPYLNGKIEKAERVLLDFAKTPLLKVGESCTVELSFTAYDLASYDDKDANGNGFTGYELDGGSDYGNYEFAVMLNAHDQVSAKQMTLAGNIQYSVDPVTGNPVGNLFTGSKAYASCPIDGSTAFSSQIDYLSRKDQFANFPKTSVGTSSNTVTDAAAKYVYDGYNDKNVSSYNYGIDMGLYLVGVEQEGSAPLKATVEQLNGKDTSVVLVFNTEILELLTDYDSIYWDFFLDQLSQDDINNLIGLGGFQTVELLSIGKPRCEDKDGPAGFNDNVSSPGKSSVYTLYPSESLLGCSWSTEVAYDIGEAQALIGQSVGFNGWYGPGVNLHRSVYNSRNYEYYSEDGVLSGKLASYTIEGAKENNLYCYIKHFAVSEAGNNPKNLNTWLTEQALRENYLKPFEIAVKSGANAVMSAFNRVGAVLSGYNHALLTSVLREEWGFRGSVITDWYMKDGYMNDHEAGVIAGNDLWLCGTITDPAGLNFSNPAVAYAARQSAKNILFTYIDTYATASSSIKVNAAPQSPLYVAMFVLIDVVLFAGIVVCVTFAVLLVVRKKKKQSLAAESVAAEENLSGNNPDGETSENSAEEK